MTPLVSVIMPTYDRAAVVKEAVESVLRQTYLHLELLVIDDGSTDDTLERLNQISDKRLRVILANHRGAASARNQGLKEAKGEFIGFCDSDDLWVPEKLVWQVDYLAKHPEAGLVYGDVMSFRGGKIETPSYFKERAPRDGQVFFDMIEKNFIPNVSILVRKACLDEVGSFNESLKTSEDYELWLRFCQRFQVGHVEEVLVKVRRHSGNITSDDQTTCENHLAVLNSVKSRFKGRIPKSVMHKAYARTYRHMGYNHLLHRRFKESQWALLQSLQFDPFSPATYRYWAASLLPKKILNGLLTQRSPRVSA